MTDAAALALGPIAVLLYADACRRRATFYDQNAALAEARDRAGPAAAFRMRAADFRAEASRAELWAESASNTGLLAQNGPLHSLAPDGATHGISDLAVSLGGVTFGPISGGHQ